MVTLENAKNVSEMLVKTIQMERLVSIAAEYKLTIDLSDEEVVFIDSIYRGSHPAEKGLLPLGEPSEGDAARALDIAGRILGSAR